MSSYIESFWSLSTKALMRPQWKVFRPASTLGQWSSTLFCEVLKRLLLGGNLVNEAAFLWAVIMFVSMHPTEFFPTWLDFRFLIKIFCLMLSNSDLKNASNGFHADNFVKLIDIFQMAESRIDQLRTPLRLPFGIQMSISGNYSWTIAANKSKDKVTRSHSKHLNEMFQKLMIEMEGCTSKSPETTSLDGRTTYCCCCHWGYYFNV